MPTIQAVRLQRHQRVGAPHQANRLAVGRQAVRFILASMPFSTMQLNAAAAPATSQMPAQANSASRISAQAGAPGTASTMPISAQNTMSCTTRGLVSA